MKLIVGLGNPGAQYAATRHNIGFWAVDAIARRLGVAVDRDKFRAHVGQARVGTGTVWLMKPQTFMNLSGEAVREFLASYREVDPATDLIVIYDDMDFPLGTVRLRVKGSAGGHNGMKSVISCVGTEAFPRVRIGIGRPQPGMDVIRHVLSPFDPAEQQTARDAAERAAEAVLYALDHGFDAAMNRFNAL
ncbi:MAG: aminoacyl-tRNA hydrolase [Thermoflavifilum sp.]|nr:aminoacyl-tRNA hydrolase [Thermoflavifilum sp.]MCL6513750.1 aminoacyl-tRNA hydrolase [Alicyclobacillus sp.]